MLNHERQKLVLREKVVLVTIFFLFYRFAFSKSAIGKRKLYSRAVFIDLRTYSTTTDFIKIVQLDLPFR
jgi:hypothetical protein